MVRFYNLRLDPVVLVGVALLIVAAWLLMPISCWGMNYEINSVAINS